MATVGTLTRGVTARPGGTAKREKRRALRDASGFLAPFMAVYLLFLAVPVLRAVYISGFRWDLLGGDKAYVGLHNYTRMLWGTDMTWSLGNLWVVRVALLGIVALLVRTAAARGASVGRQVLTTVPGLAVAAVLGLHPSASGAWNDPGFWIAMKNTLYFTCVSTPLLVGLGLVLALALTTRRRFTAFYRTFFFLPYVLPVSAVTLIWSYLLNPDRGLIAGVLHTFGMSSISFLSDPHLAMPAIIATTVWWSVGFNLVLFAAGLQDIDASLYEAAALDGANAWQRFRNVTVPGLRHVTVLVAVTQLIASFQVFGQVYIMTKGGPGTATQVFIQHIYEAGFKNYQLGYAATLSVFLFVVMSAVSALQFKLIGKAA